MMDIDWRQAVEFEDGTPVVVREVTKWGATIQTTKEYYYNGTHYNSGYKLTYDLDGTHAFKRMPNVRNNPKHAELERERQNTRFEEMMAIPEWGLF